MTPKPLTLSIPPWAANKLVIVTVFACYVNTHRKAPVNSLVKNTRSTPVNALPSHSIRQQLTQ